MASRKILEVEFNGYHVCNLDDLVNSKIDRMCATDNVNELLRMKKYAIKYIEEIYEINLRRIGKV